MYTTNALDFENPRVKKDSLIKLFTIEEINNFNASKDFEEYKTLLVKRDKLTSKQSKESESPIIHLVQVLCMMIFIMCIGAFTEHPDMFIVLSMGAALIYPLVFLFIGIYKMSADERTERFIYSKLKYLKDNNKILVYIEEYLMDVEANTSGSKTLTEYKEFFSKLPNYDNVTVYFSNVNLLFKELHYDVMFKNIVFKELKTGTYFTYAYNVSSNKKSLGKTEKLNIFNVNIRNLELTPVM